MRSDSKTFINFMAEDLNAMEEQMERYRRDRNNQDIFNENCGAYFTLLKYAQKLEVSFEVYEARQSIRKVAA